MRQSRFTETRIVYAVKQMNLGVPAREIAREYGVSEKMVHVWRREYDGLSPSGLRRLKELERESSQLKKIVAELSLDKWVLQDVLRERL